MRELHTSSLSRKQKQNNSLILPFEILEEHQYNVTVILAEINDLLDWPNNEKNIQQICLTPVSENFRGNNAATNEWFSKTPFISTSLLLLNENWKKILVDKRFTSSVNGLNKDTWQSLIQDLNLGGDMNVPNRWSITNVKKYCKQIGLLCWVLCRSYKNMFTLKDKLCFRYNVLE